MEKFLWILFSCFVGSITYAKGRYDISAHVTGKEAQDIYEALHVPVQKEKSDFSAPELKFYKIGKNILCLKTLSAATAAENTATYFCSAGFSATGESESSGVPSKH